MLPPSPTNSYTDFSKEYTAFFFMDYQYKNSKCLRAINKNDQRDAAWSICLYYACKSILHVSGALCTHHQECTETVHEDSGTIVL